MLYANPIVNDTLLLGNLNGTHIKVYLATNQRWQVKETNSSTHVTLLRNNFEVVCDLDTFDKFFRVSPYSYN